MKISISTMPVRSFHPRFRSHVRSYRHERRISQKQMAIDLGISKTTLIAIEWARTDPSLLLCLRIAKYLGTTLNSLFSEREPKKNS